MRTIQPGIFICWRAWAGIVCRALFSFFCNLIAALAGIAFMGTIGMNLKNALAE